jgi:hypothetical protein
MSDDLEQRTAQIVLTRCLNQVFKSKGLYRAEGQGDCRTCEYDPVKNPQCSRYVPVGVTYLLRSDDAPPS